MEQSISTRANRAIKEKVFPGCVVGWIKDGKKKVLPFGNFTYEIDSKKVDKDSIYDVASITKVIPTSCLLLDLVHKGQISLEDQVAKYVSGFRKPEVIIKHLLSYTLNLEISSMTSLAQKPVQEIIDTVIKAPLREKPGVNYLYTNSTAALMGFIVSKVTGKKLPDLAEERFFNPLGMRRSTFEPLKKFSKEEVVPTEVSDWRGGLLQGEVHDESTYILQKNGYYLGAAGLFSTVPDLLIFSEMIFKNTHFLELGWQSNEPKFMGKYVSEIKCKTGFTGCILMINLKKNSVLVILSNRVYPKRPEDKEAINRLRTEIANIIFE
ncbi:MAG: serine hydrolase domain-containing protein [Patescibacteria group bacterium]